MRIYIAGPMTGLPEFNYPAFNAAATGWRLKGWDVINPAEHFGGATDRLYREYVEVDINALKRCDAIAVLPGWDSPTARGSVWEYMIAKYILGIECYDATKPFPAVWPRCAGWKSGGICSCRGGCEGNAPSLKTREAMQLFFEEVVHGQR